MIKDNHETYLCVSAYVFVTDSQNYCFKKNNNKNKKKMYNLNTDLIKHETII